MTKAAFLSLNGKMLEALGDASSLIVRSRTITASRFVISLLTSLGTHRIESIADLQRDFNANFGTSVFYKPYYEKMDARLSIMQKHQLKSARTPEHY